VGTCQLHLHIHSVPYLINTRGIHHRSAMSYHHGLRPVSIRFTFVAALRVCRAPLLPLSLLRAFRARRDGDTTDLAQHHLQAVLKDKKRCGGVGRKKGGTNIRRAYAAFRLTLPASPLPKSTHRWTLRGGFALRG